MTVTAKPTTAQHRFLTAIADDGGVSTRAMTLVGSWRPINISKDNGWVAEEPRPGGHPGQIRHRLLADGYRAIGREVPAPGTPEGDALLTDEEKAAAGWVVDQDEVDRLLDDAIGPQSAGERVVVATGWDGASHPVLRYRDEQGRIDHNSVVSRADHDRHCPKCSPATKPAPASTVLDCDGREFGADARVEVVGDYMRGARGTVTGVIPTTPGGATVALRVDGFSNPFVRLADEVRVIDEPAEPAGLPSGYNDDPVEDDVDEAALWTPDPLPVPAPVEVAPVARRMREAIAVEAAAEAAYERACEVAREAVADRDAAGQALLAARNARQALDQPARLVITHLRQIGAHRYNLCPAVGGQAGDPGTATCEPCVRAYVEAEYPGFSVQGIVTRQEKTADLLVRARLAAGWPLCDFGYPLGGVRPRVDWCRLAADHHGLHVGTEDQNRTFTSRMSVRRSKQAQAEPPTP